MSLPTVKHDFNTIRIYYGDVLHLCLNRLELFGVQSWICDGYRYAIEYYHTSGATVRTEYDKREHFEHILSELEKIL